MVVFEGLGERVDEDGGGIVVDGGECDRFWVNGGWCSDMVLIERVVGMWVWNVC